MSMKCVHKGCGKTLPSAEFETDICVYHPNEPDFHEGQKGWKCCKPRVLTFDEFLEIPPCTRGQHSAVDDTPKPQPKPSADDLNDKVKALNERASLPSPVARLPQATAAPARATPTPKSEVVDESDDPDTPVPDGAACRRRGCGQTYKASQDRSQEECVHHPGVPIFHEGTKGNSCCKPRMLDFDDFLKIKGCTTKPRHLFVGKKKDPNVEEEIKDPKFDFYQTAVAVNAALFVKKIDKERSKMEFVDETTVDLDLHTTDRKRYKTLLTLFAPIKAEESSFKIMGTKLELSLVKASAVGWPVLRADDKHTGEIIQAGRAGTV
ncbi:chord-domain-containing protein [Polychaeton citri CBS 116435]|uniref:Chord-domain-containing protein n=1 Tax=Polychaeton citri CBS 116435 TaxID=1314669 RepID=A0A9P4Q8Y8_9PEZI|nr:chord-domain-containing protein [Polychaeton citri CBS 116435]